jgi:hypothetical protein
VRAISGVLAIVIIVAIDAGADRRWAALVAPPPPPPGPPPDPGTGRLVPPPEPAVGAAG